MPQHSESIKPTLSHLTICKIYQTYTFMQQHVDWESIKSSSFYATTRFYINYIWIIPQYGKRDQPAGITSCIFNKFCSMLSMIPPLVLHQLYSNNSAVWETFNLPPWYFPNYILIIPQLGEHEPPTPTGIKSTRFK